MNPIVRLATGALGATLMVLVCGGAARAADNFVDGKIMVIKDTKLFKVVAKDASKVPFTIPLPMSGGDPTFGGSGGDLAVIDTGSAGALSDSLVAGVWTGLGNPPGSKGYKYKNVTAPTGGAVKTIILKSTVIKIIAKDDGTLADSGVTGNVAITLSVGSNPDRYCAEFGGSTIKNEPGLVKRKDAPAPAGCGGAGPTTTSSSVTTTTSSTTTSTFGPCCGGFTHGVYTSGPAAGTCGTITDFNGGTFASVTCGGLYFGGGANAVPLPAITPDLGSTVVALTSCAVQTATVGPTTSTQTGSNLNCSSPGCFFGGPLSIPNTASTPTSTCVINTVKVPISGTVECGLGEQNVNLPLDSEIFLTGDTGTDPGDTIPGIQPCPICTGGDPMTPLSGTCIGGTNDMGTCTPNDTNQGGTQPGYPTSHDCPPDPMLSIGTIPINLALTTGTVKWTATVATNDTGSTISAQSRVFCGYCRDTDGSSSFEQPFHQCQEAGAAVGPACSGTFESCEQRDHGAYGPGGGAVKTLTVTGTPAGNAFDGNPHAQKLVTNFCIPPTFDPTVDASADLPGPGTLALTGLTELCSSPNPCPGP
jgi:hypothetical protein